MRQRKYYLVQPYGAFVLLQAPFYLKNIQSKHFTMKNPPNPRNYIFAKIEGNHERYEDEPVFFPYYELQWKSKTTSLGTKGKARQLTMDWLHWNTICF